MRSKMAINKKCPRVTKGTRRILCSEYNLKHNQNNKYIPQIHVHPQLAQSQNLSEQGTYLQHKCTIIILKGGLHRKHGDGDSTNRRTMTGEG